MNTGSRFRAVFQAASSLAAGLGVFDKINRHEPKSPPGRGLNLAIWIDGFDPASSGLDATSARLDVVYRIYTPMVTEPQDEIEPTMLDAIDQLCSALIGDYTLGGLVRAVDVRGADGRRLTGRAGYVDYGGHKYRSFDVAASCVVNDLWSEVP